MGQLVRSNQNREFSRARNPTEQALIEILMNIHRNGVTQIFHMGIIKVDQVGGDVNNRMTNVICVDNKRKIP
jgi:hypothetical protein